MSALKLELQIRATIQLVSKHSALIMYNVEVYPAPFLYEESEES